MVLEILWPVTGVLGRLEALTQGLATVTFEILRPVNVLEMLDSVKVVRETSRLVKLMLELPRRAKQV